ncbi:hypothetical protein, partial [Chromobacterium haemolyticum]|uniref:hypothetical protein n=1 Tax=Chromobacterium haemolyticum TaxID=394935 RepID=UPI0009EFDA3B
MTFRQKIVGLVIAVMLVLLWQACFFAYQQNKVASELRHTQQTLLEDSAQLSDVFNDAQVIATNLMRVLLWMVDEQTLHQEVEDLNGGEGAAVKLTADSEVILKRIETGLTNIKMHSDHLSEKDASRMLELRQVIRGIEAESLAGMHRLILAIANGKGDIKQAHKQWMLMNWNPLVMALSELEELSQKGAQAGVVELEKLMSRLQWISLVTGLLVLLLVGGALLWQLRFVSRTIGGRMERLFRHMDHIAKDDFSQPIRYRPGMEQSLIALLAKLQERLKAAKAMVVENARIRVALDSSSANVMLVDERRQISFVNRALQARLPQLANR